jgi:hypothetical protein
MNPETAKTLVAQRHDELVHATASRKSGPSRRLFPRWHVSWTRTVLAPVGPVAPMGPATPATRTARRGSSVVIIISAHRSA